MRTTLIVLTLVLWGCSGHSISNREGGLLGGAAIGAGLGAIVGAATGDAGVGTAIGGGIGALSGAVIGNEMDKAQAYDDERDRRLSENDRLIEENRKLIEALRNRGFDVRSTDRGVVINLPDVLFPFDSSELTQAARQDVAIIASTLNDIGPRRIAIEGHTDSIGTPLYNQRLSERRALSVQQELQYQGIPRDQMRYRGFGENDPIARNDTEEGRRRNRRVEVIIEN